MKKNRQSKKLGQLGEIMTLNYLGEKGWKILEHNWRPQGARSIYELDIIAMEKQDLVFVEVKTRANGQKIPVHTAFTSRKKESMLKAAQLYLSENKCWDKPCRFDLVCIWQEDGQAKIEHYKNVFKLGNSLRSSDSSWQPW